MKRILYLLLKKDIVKKLKAKYYEEQFIDSVTEALGIPTNLLSSPGRPIQPGDKVTYVPTYGPEEKGIVSSLGGSDESVFVVYHCDGDWDNYRNYTAAKTKITDLRRGWK